MRGRRCGKAAVIRWILQDPETDESLTALEGEKKTRREIVEGVKEQTAVEEKKIP